MRIDKRYERFSIASQGYDVYDPEEGKFAVVATYVPKYLAKRFGGWRVFIARPMRQRNDCVCFANFGTMRDDSGLPPKARYYIPGVISRSGVVELSRKNGEDPKSVFLGQGETISEARELAERYL